MNVIVPILIIGGGVYLAFTISIFVAGLACAGDEGVDAAYRRQSRKEAFRAPLWPIDFARFCARTYRGLRNMPKEDS